MVPDADRTAGTPRRKLAETVAQRIRDTARTLEPGTRLPSMAELSEQLGVGRSTLREALSGLETIGVVEVRHGQGVYVADRAPGADQLQFSEITPEGVEARSLVEPELAALAAQRRTMTELARLGEILTRHARHLTEGEGPIIEATEFHLAVVEIARNEILAGVVRPFLKVAFDQGPALYQTHDDYADWELAEHQGIFEAIANGDGELARERARAHVGAMSPRYLGEDDSSA